MAVKKALVLNQQTGLGSPVQTGEVIGGAEVAGVLTTAGAGTLTAALLINSLLNRTGPTAGFTDTTDTAANIIAALAGQNFVGTGSPGGAGGVQPGTTWRLRYVNGVAYAMTLAAGTGVTIATGNVTASYIKDYLLTVTNGTPQQIFVANVDGSTAVITGMTQSQTNLLSVGMLVTGTGIAASSNIISIQPGVGVTLNNNTTVANTSAIVTFNPTVTMTGIGQFVA